MDEKQKNKYINYSGSETPEYLKSRRMAQMLQMQQDAAAPIDTNQTGTEAPIATSQGLAKIADMYLKKKQFDAMYPSTDEPTAVEKWASNLFKSKTPTAKPNGFSGNK